MKNYHYYAEYVGIGTDAVRKFDGTLLLKDYVVDYNKYQQVKRMIKDHFDVLKNAKAEEIVILSLTLLFDDE